MKKILKIFITIIVITLIFSTPVIADNNNLKTSYLNYYYHKQMDNSEYKGYFSPAIKNVFGNTNIEVIRSNSCGLMTLTNVLDIMSEKKKGELSGITPIELANKYFVDDENKIILTYHNSEPALNSKVGLMSHTALYWLADIIGEDTKLWEMKLIFGNNNSTFTSPVQKSELVTMVANLQKEVFNKNGIAIFSVMINGEWNENYSEEYILKDGYPKYMHFIVVMDMKMNKDGTARMLVVDSMGSEHKGYYGWVNSNAYTFAPTEYNSKLYTGILNVYGVVPQ
jgi:hypothetical protein